MTCFKKKSAAEIIFHIDFTQSHQVKPIVSFCEKDNGSSMLLNKHGICFAAPVPAQPGRPFFKLKSHCILFCNGLVDPAGIHA
jgi:hypothetical protein